MLKSLLSKPGVQQFIRYFCVGGISSVVEWVLFHIFANMFEIQYLLATVCAVIFSTTVNWFLGRVFVFKDSERFKDKAVQEVIIIFAVAFIGMLLNLVFMWLFVSMLGMDTDLLKVVSKMTATAIVFMYNFLARKLVIYR